MRSVEQPKAKEGRSEMSIDSPRNTIHSNQDRMPAECVPSIVHSVTTDRNQWNEENWRVHIESLTGGVHRLCPHGRIADIVSSELLVEIKGARNLFDGIEQLDHYHTCFPCRDTILFVFGNDFPIRKIAKAGGWNSLLKELLTLRSWLNIRFDQPPIGLESMKIDWSTYITTNIITNRFEFIRRNLVKFEEALRDLEKAKALITNAMTLARLDDISDTTLQLLKKIEDLKVREREYYNLEQLTQIYVQDELMYGTVHIIYRIELENHYINWFESKTKLMGITCNPDAELLSRILIGFRGVKQAGNPGHKGRNCTYTYIGVKPRELIMLKSVPSASIQTS